MYAPAPYHVEDKAKIRDLIDAFPFATLVRNGTGGPVAAYMPLVRKETPEGDVLVGHMARANDFWRNANGKDVVALFAGPDAYISPSNYPSKLAHGKVVLTWNYVRVEARGRLFVEVSPDRLRHYIDMPTALMERMRETPWSADDAPAEFVRTLSNAIVGIRIDITSLEGSWKLDQRKAAMDRESAVAGLRLEGKDDVAKFMREA